MDSVQALRRSVVAVLRGSCAFLMFALAALVLFQVTFRFVFRTPFDWAEELARYSFIWVSMLGAILGVDAKAHFYVDILPSKLSPRARRGLDLALRTVVFVFLAVVAYLSVTLVTVMRSQTSPILELPLGYMAIALPIGFFGMCAFVLVTGTFEAPPPEAGGD